MKASRLALSVEEQAAGAVDVILRDGGTLRLRPPAAADADALLAFFARLSEREPLPALPRHPAASTRRSSSRSSTPTGPRRGALVGAGVEATERSSRSGELRPPARPDAGRGRVRRRRRRAGPRDRHAAARAARRARGRDRRSRASSPRCWRRTGRCSASSPDAGFERRRASSSGGEVEVRFPIAPTETFRARVERARPRRRRRLAAAVLRAARPSPSIGASRRRGSIGGELFRNILDADFAGAAYPVNRGGEPVAGVRALRARSRRSPTRSTSP